MMREHIPRSIITLLTSNYIYATMAEMPQFLKQYCIKSLTSIPARPRAETLCLSEFNLA